MKVKHIFYMLFIFFTNNSFAQSRSDNVYVALSQRFLAANIQRVETEKYIKKYMDIDLDDLESSLDTYNKQFAFWVNTYNAFIQYQLLKDPSLLDYKSTFYTNESIELGSIMISFDIIEHGIIRNSRWKLGLGYIKKWSATDFEKRFRTKGKDGRAHFALNCGARSCPPIAIYSDQNLDALLSQVIKYFLPKVTDHNSDTVTTTPLFSWFRGDFGGSSGIKEFLSKYNIIEVGDLNLEYGEYDWTLDLENFYSSE